VAESANAAVTVSTFNECLFSMYFFLGSGEYAGSGMPAHRETKDRCSEKTSSYQEKFLIFRKIKVGPKNE
jgi:hypothetical protein